MGCVRNGLPCAAIWCIVAALIAMFPVAHGRGGLPEPSPGEPGRTEGVAGKADAAEKRAPSKAAKPDAQEEKPAATRADASKAGTAAAGTDDEAEIVRRLEHVLAFARETHDRMEREVQDYTCQLVLRMRTEGRLGEFQHMEVKIRHERKEGDKVTVPFAAFIRFLGPEAMEGREVLYIEGQDFGRLIARQGGPKNPNLTLKLEPNSPLAMKGNRYPVTEIGMLTLGKRLIEVLEEELGHKDAEVKIFKNAKLYGRPCTHFRLLHEKCRPDSRYQQAEVLVDDELNIPVYFRSYDWPKEGTDKPILLEELAFTDVKLNVGLTDKDFDRGNPEYHFKPESEEVSTPTDVGEQAD